MTDTGTDVLRAANYEIAEAIAPTGERHRADIEKVATPVREWMLRGLRPRLGATAAGVGDTGFEAAVAGGQGRLISTGFSLTERGHIPSPEPPPAPGILSQANAERTAALLQDSFARFAAGYELPRIALCAVGS